MMKQRSILIFLFATVLLSGVYLAFWLPGSDFAKRFAQKHPAWAWRHGSPEMQGSAARVLLRNMVPGTDMNEIVARLGPGALGWPEEFQRDYSGESTAGFNVRAPYQQGLLVHYRDGKVVSVSFYD